MTHSHASIPTISALRSRARRARIVLRLSAVTIVGLLGGACDSETTYDSLSCYPLTDAQPVCSSKGQYQAKFSEGDSVAGCNDTVTVLSEGIERPADQAEPDAGPISESNPPRECCHLIRSTSSKPCFGEGRPFLVNHGARVAALARHDGWSR